MEEICAYCSNILSSTRQTPTRPWNKVIYETSSFVITPTVGALIEGWALIISKRHVPAMGALTQSELTELSELALKTRNLMRATYGSAVIFEHGPACAGTAFGCGIDHAHFHIVPLHIALAPLVEKDLRQPVEWEVIADVRDLSGIHMRKKSYLYILEDDKTQGIAVCLLDIPSQYIRRLIARYLEIPHLYNYRKYKFRQNAITTFNRLETAFNKEACLVKAK